MVIGIVVIVALIALFFIPTNQFLGTESHNPESPPPIAVLSNTSDDFGINPSKCAAESGMVEFQLDVENKLNDDYRLEIHLVLNDKNGENLSREAILVEIQSGETTTVSHQTPFDPDFAMCQIELKRSEKIE